jgi:hypothetical protein
MPLPKLEPGATEMQDRTTLPPAKQKGWVLELHVPMRQGERLGFEYEADGALAFNIHSHHGKEVTHHVHREAASGSGMFASEEDCDYYPMWENGLDRPVTLRYRLWRIRA